MISGGTLPRTTRTLPTGCLMAFDERCTTLAQFPYIGTSRDELMPALRSLPVGNCLIRSTCRFLMVLKSSGCCPVLRDIDAFF